MIAYKSLKLMVVFGSFVWGSEPVPTEHCGDDLQCLADTVAGSSMLQKQQHKVDKAMQTAVPSAAKALEEAAADDTAEPSDGELEPPGTVNWDGYSKLHLPRKSTPGGFPAEVLFRISRDQANEMNGTHIFFPYDKMMRGTFVKDLHAIGGYQYGVANILWVKQKVSVMGNNIVVGMAEKLHVLEHEGEWPRHSVNAYKQEQESRWKVTKLAAEWLRDERSYAVNLWNMASRTGAQIGSAVWDPSIKEDIQAFARENNHVPTEDLTDRMAVVAANLTAKHHAYVEKLKANSVPPTSSSTSMGCFHFTAAPGLEDAGNGAWVPLQRLLPSVRGMITAAPLQHFSGMDGAAIVQYNAELDSIDIYQGAAGYGELMDPTLPTDTMQMQPGLYVGPADGKSRAIAPEGRKRYAPLSFARAVLNNLLYNAWASIPASYELLFESPESLCSQTTLENIQKEYLEYDLMHILYGGASTGEKLGLLSLLGRMVDCSTDYLRADEMHSHAFNGIESTGFVHGAAEFSSGLMMRGWNTIDESLFF